MVKMLLGGSPCTHWSIAQTKNRETEPSGLGWELFLNYRIALEKYKPDYFLYENNKSMSKAIRAQIIKEFGFEPVLINSALVSAQSRQRLYWVGSRNPDGTYSRVDVEQPEDRGILLRDILESGQGGGLEGHGQGLYAIAVTGHQSHLGVEGPAIFQRPHGFNKGGVKYGKAPTLTANCEGMILHEHEIYLRCLRSRHNRRKIPHAYVKYLYYSGSQGA